MATIRLGRHTSREEDLPDVCLKCGAPTTLRVKKKFSWYPLWVYVFLLIPLLFIIVAAIMTWRRTVSAPLCAEHRRHWFWRNVIIFLGIVGVLGLLIAPFAVLPNAGRGQGALVGLVVLTGVPLGLVGWVGMTIWLRLTAIRPTEITDHSITLAGVAEEFVRVYEEEWLPDPDLLDRAVGERWGGEDRPGRREERFEARDESEERGNPPDTYREG
jgi:hypothetical protein